MRPSPRSDRQLSKQLPPSAPTTTKQRVPHGATLLPIRNRNGNKIRTNGVCHRSGRNNQNATRPTGGKSKITKDNRAQVATESQFIGRKSIGCHRPAPVARFRPEDHFSTRTDARWSMRFDCIRLQMPLAEIKGPEMTNSDSSSPTMLR
jgi:hypothetical protein